MKKFSARPLAIFMLGAAAAGLVYRTETAAQSPVIRPGDDLRPINVTSQDIADGKQFADTACAGCHGVEGISSTTGIPNLAGQRPAYLYRQLKTYQSGGRVNAAMNTSVRFIADEALVKVSAYYASLDPAQPPPGPPPTYLDPAQDGKTAAAACAGCHGELGISKTPGIPSLAGLAPQYLTAAMKAYRSGQRNNDMMKSMLAAASDSDIDHMALYYALQKPVRTETPSAGDQQAGKAVTAGCAGCHGDQGVSSTAATPSLAGQDAQYLMAALEAYKKGERADETMKALAASLDENAVKDIAAYYTAQEPARANVRPPPTAAEWAQKCDRCHGTNGNSTDPRIPALAAQRREYLQTALHDFQTGRRASHEMAAMSDVLSDDEIKNLAAYYSHQNARAVVFIAPPNK